MGPATNYYVHRHNFPLYRGGRLSSLQLAWESWGTLNAKRSNAVLLFTGLSPGAHAARTTYSIHGYRFSSGTRSSRCVSSVPSSRPPEPRSRPRPRGTWSSRSTPG